MVHLLIAWFSGKLILGLSEASIYPDFAFRYKFLNAVFYQPIKRDRLFYCSQFGNILA